MIALVGGVTSANSEVHAYSASAPRPVPKTSHGCASAGNRPWCVVSRYT